MSAGLSFLNMFANCTGKVVMFVYLLGNQVNYNDTCLVYGMPMSMANRTNLTFAERVLLDGFIRNHKTSGQVEWQWFGLTNGLGYVYPANRHANRESTNTEVRLR